MAFPTSPVNEQQATVNGITYTYNSTDSAWYRTGTILTANITSNMASTSTTTGALQVAGGVGIVGNINIGGTTYVTGDILPTSNNTVNIGSATRRFGTLYLAANTIDLGGTTITTAPTGELVFATPAGNVNLSTNTISFLSTVANTSNQSGDLNITGNLTVNKIYATSYFYANGAALTGGTGGTGAPGATGYTGSQGAAGYTGSQGTFLGTTSSTIATSNTTASTSTTTGALQVAGGAGIAGNVYAGAVYTSGLYWSGNGSVISTGGGGGSSSISNGNSNVVVTFNGNVSTSVGSTSDVIVATTTGISVKGNVSAGNGYFTGNVFSSYSDVRLKTILGTIEHPTDKVSQIETFYYEPNELAVSLGMSPGHRQVGVSAQSVQTIMPEAVAPSPIDQNYLTVQYERLIPLLIEAVKKLTTEVEQLKKHLESK
jgi:hypothetical protein